MTEPTEPTDTLTPIQHDPVLVLAFAPTNGSTDSTEDFGTALTAGDIEVAIWQLETDPAIGLGDYSGAWVVTSAGIEGFAATAEWIPDRDDPRAMLTSLLSHPVIVLPPVSTAASEAPSWQASEVIAQIRDYLGIPSAEQGRLEFIDLDATAAAIAAEHATAREQFAAAFEGKRQPQWGTPAPLPSPATVRDAADATAVSLALHAARALREWMQHWHGFEKVRSRRLGPAVADYASAQGVPWVRYPA